jgi:hypothetical protein
MGAGAKASTVIANPLSKEGKGGSAPRGRLKGWDHVLLIDHELLNPKTAQWGPAYWVAGHLVSQWLHGPGDPWNTVPMRKIDNKAMEKDIEEDTIKRINNEEVLHYKAHVDYHKGDIVEDFPSHIDIERGSLRYQDGKWSPGEELSPFSAELDPPPLDPNYVPDINDLRRDGLYKRGIPFRFALAIETERDSGGKFNDPIDFNNRMKRLYAQRGGSADDKLSEGLAAVAGLIGKKIRIGG